MDLHDGKPARILNGPSQDFRIRATSSNCSS